MHNRFPLRPEGRPQRLPHPAFDPERPKLAEQKLAAWALTIGVRLPGEAQPARRAHRAWLPDIDMRPAEPESRPPRTGLFAWRR